MPKEDTATESCKCNGVCSRVVASLAYSAPKDANALRPAKIARIR